MLNTIKITNKNGNIEKIEVRESLELTIQNGDHVFIDERLNSVQLEVVNTDNLKVVLPNETEIILNDIAQLISENPSADIPPQFSDEELINSLTTKLAFLQNDLLDGGAVITSDEELFAALEVAASSKDAFWEDTPVQPTQTGQNSTRVNAEQTEKPVQTSTELISEYVAIEQITSQETTSEQTPAENTPSTSLLAYSEDILKDTTKPTSKTEKHTELILEEDMNPELQISHHFEASLNPNLTSQEKHKESWLEKDGETFEVYTHEDLTVYVDKDVKKDSNESIYDA